MPEGLQLRLLGVPNIDIAGDSVTGSLSSKAQAILYYLVVTGQPQTRTALATLLWGDMPEAAARSNLRRALVDLRWLLHDFLDIDRHAVAFKGDSLIINLPLPTASIKRLQAAIELYRGDFLVGFYVLHAPDFESWMPAIQRKVKD